MVDLTARLSSNNNIIASKVQITTGGNALLGLGALTDVTITNPADGSYLIYQNSSNTFIDDSTIVKTSSGITLTGGLVAGSLDISGDVDVDGTLETDALTIAGVTLAETISDTVGAMVTNNSTGGISVTYQDSDNTIDFDVSDFSITLTGDVTGSGTVTNLGNLSFATTVQSGSIENGMLDNNTITVSDGSNTSPVALGGTLTFAGTSNEVTVAENAGTVTIGLPDDVTIAGDLSVSTAPTAGAHVTNKTYVDAKVSALVDSAPGTLDTLNELAAALGDDANYATTTASTIGEKLVKTSNLSDLANAATARTNLGLGTAATTAATAYATAAQGTKADNALVASTVSTFGGTLIDDANAGAARTTLGLGTAATTDASAYATAAQGTKADNALVASTVSTFGGTLIDDANASAARTTLGLGTAATTAATAYLASDGTATKATVSDSTANTNFPVVFNNESDGLLDDTGTFIYNPSTGLASATGFSGALTGTLQTAAQANITSVGTLTGLTTGATTVNGLLTVNNDTLQLTSTTASSGTENPALELYRNGGSGSGQLGAIKFFGNNNVSPTPEKFEYAGIYADVQVATDGSEQGSLKFSLGHAGAQEDPAMALFSYGLQMGYGNPILMSYSNGYQQFFSPNAAQKSFKVNATPNATVANGAYDIYLPDVAGGTLVAANSDKALTAGATTVNGDLTVNATTQSLTNTTSNSNSTYGPNIEVYRNGGAATSSGTVLSLQNKLGAIDFFGNNDAGTPEKIKYAKVFGSIITKTDGSEDGRLSFSVMSAGTHTEGANPATILDLEPDVAVFKQDVRIQATAADAGANASPTPILELYQEDGPTADDGDHLGEIQFTALNDNGYSPVKHKYAGIHAEIIDESNATEDGSLHFTCIKAGTEDNTVLTLNGSGSTLFSDLVAPLTIRSTDTNADLIIQNDTDSADASPIIKLLRNAGSGGHADGEDIGKIEFYGNNDRGLGSGGPEDILFATMFTEVVDSSDGTEDGQIKFTAIKAGSATDILTLNGSGSTLTGGLTASQTIANAVTDTDISVSEFATYDGKKVIYTGGAGSVHLADAVAGDVGKAWTFINAGTGAITVNRATSTQTIKLLNGSSVSAGSANLTVATGGIIEIICTAADNYIAFGSGIS